MRSSAPIAAPARRRAASAGATLTEVLVTLGAFIGLLVAVLVVFDASYRQARARAAAAAAESALDAALGDVEQLVRWAGRGGLPPELALTVRGNVPPGATIGAAGTPRVVAGSDVLTVRGVLSTPLFRVHSGDALPSAGGGSLVVRDPSPQTGASQRLTELALAVEAGGPAGAPLLLAGADEEAAFAVVELLPALSSVSREGGRVRSVRLAFLAAETGGGDLAAALRELTWVGLLEEYRLFAREAHGAPGVASSPPHPQLCLARFGPRGTLEPGPGVLVDLADRVFDLQVSLGLDLDGDGLLTAGEWLDRDPGPAAGGGRRAPPRSVRIVLEVEERSPAPAGARRRLEAVVDLATATALRRGRAAAR